MKSLTPGKLTKKMNIKGPDTTKDSMQNIKVQSPAKFAPGKKGKGFKGPDLSGGGWVS